MRKNTYTAITNYSGTNKLENKPTHEIQKIINICLPYASVLLRRADHTLNSVEMSKRQCFLLHAGHVSVCRQSDGLVLNTENAPFIFGFSDFLQTSQNLTIYPGRGAEISILPLEKAKSVIAEKKEWESIAKLLMYISRRLFSHCTRTSQMTSYSTIKVLLLELFNEPEALRQTTPAFQYIQSRCLLSRSGILYTLSKLRKGNYITLENGKLVEMGCLPLKF